MSDVTKSTLPKSKTWNDYAEEMLAQFPGVDRAKLLTAVVAATFFEMKYGNKREERAACDFLNLVSAQAIKQLQEAAKLRQGEKLIAN